MAWKPGDKARIVQDDPVYLSGGLPSRVGQTVTILATNCGGFAHLKVRNHQGDVFYCRPAWLRKPNQPDDKKQTRAIKAQAAALAEKRMTEIKKVEEMTVMTAETTPATLPMFSDVSEKFFALAEFAKTTDENAIHDIVLHLAEKQLFAEIKNGVIWDGD